MRQEFRSVNPANELLLNTWKCDDNASVEQAIDTAHGLFRIWRTQAPDTRIGLLLRIASVIEASVEKYARLISAEMGKPIRESRAELLKCASAFRFYADNAVAMLEARPVPGVGRVVYQPLGPVLAIMPWNFPFWQIFRVLAPSIAIGNPILLKHAENVCGCAKAVESIVRAAGAPEGTLRTLLVSTDTIESIIADERIAGVTLTGSERAGSAVATLAGKHLKPAVMELGGSDPFIVLADADLSLVVGQAVRARMQNSGQSCIAAKRFIVESPIYDRFVRLFAERVKSLTCDDPAFESTDVGPIARPDLLENLEEQVRYSVGFGARLVTGGTRIGERGYFYAPTVLADLTTEHRTFKEEVFGPVASIAMVDNVEQAIEFANQTRYGLGASIWTKSDRGEEIADQIHAGNIAINQIVRSDPRAPFGGIKRSGVGRELGREGLFAFANIQTRILEG